MYDLNSIDWRPARYPGIFVNVLRRDEQSHDATVLIRMQPGCRYPAHRHVGMDEVFILQGGYHDQQSERRSGEYTLKAAGSADAPSADKLKWIEDSGDEIESLQRETVVCADCPACLPLEVAGEGEAVGCLGRINYPIDAQFEKFLADRVQLFLDTFDHEDQPRLLHILIDHESPFDGDATKELRRVTTAEGLRFYELRIPI